jgi:hypothetical protein
LSKSAQVQDTCKKWSQERRATKTRFCNNALALSPICRQKTRIALATGDSPARPEMVSPMLGRNRYVFNEMGGRCRCPERQAIVDTSQLQQRHRL